MAKRPVVKAHPVLAVVTMIIGGREKVAKKFLEQLYLHGFHIAKNQGRRPPPKRAA